MFWENIHEKCMPFSNCWGFIDGPYATQVQTKELYTIDKREHALKFQSVLVPNGLIANLYGSLEGKRHDAGMLMKSGLLNDLQQHSLDRNNTPLCLCGDDAYPY